MQTFAAHLKAKLRDERFRKVYEEERQLAELSLQLVVLPEINQTNPKKKSPNKPK